MKKIIIVFLSSLLLLFLGMYVDVGIKKLIEDFIKSVPFLLTCGGIVLFLYAVEKKSWLLPLAFVCFIAAFYTFNANRILSPLFICLLGILYFRELLEIKKWVAISAIIGFIFRAIWMIVGYVLIFGICENIEPKYVKYSMGVSLCLRFIEILLFKPY